MQEKPAPYLTLIKADRPNTRFGEVDLYLTCHTFSNNEQEMEKNFDFKANGYAIVTATGYLLFERVSADSYRFIGFTTISPKKTDQRYFVFDNEGIYGKFIR